MRELVQHMRDWGSSEKIGRSMAHILRLGADRIEELEKRLEIDPRTKYDGIDCRNVTIKELEEQIGRLESELALQKLSDFNQAHGL